MGAVERGQAIAAERSQVIAEVMRTLQKHFSQYSRNQHHRVVKISRKKKSLKKKASPCSGVWQYHICLILIISRILTAACQCSPRLLHSLSDDGNKWVLLELTDKSSSARCDASMTKGHWNLSYLSDMTALDRKFPVRCSGPCPCSVWALLISTHWISCS